MEWVLAHEFDYIFFHNNDGFLAANSLEPIVEAMEADKSIGAAQSLMLLHPETELVNSAGNVFHYLGFGFCDRYRAKFFDLKLPAIKEINYASGAALMTRVDLIKQYGAWDNDFFLYHEDLEWSFRLRMVGYKIVLIRDSVFYHKYQFSRSISKFYWMERNRYGVMLMFFRWPTLVLLAPIAIALEVGLWLFALKGGWTRERLKVYRYWLDLDHWRLWLKKRAFIQRIRKINDRNLLLTARSEIAFQEKSMRNAWLIYLGNPVMKIYYWIIVRGLVWW